MIRSRFRTAIDRRAMAVDAPNRLNMVERLMGTLEMIQSAGPMVEEEPLERAAQAIVEAIVRRDFRAMNSGQKLLGYEGGKPVMLKIHTDGSVSLNRAVPPALAKELILQLLLR